MDSARNYFLRFLVTFWTNDGAYNKRVELLSVGIEFTSHRNLQSLVTMMLALGPKSYYVYCFHELGKKVGKKFLKFCTDLSLQQCVKDKTRGENILDLVLVYDKNLIYKVSQMTPLAKSDHNVLNIVLNVTVRAESTVVKSYSYNKANYKILELAILNKEDWEDVIRKMTVNEV